MTSQKLAAGMGLLMGLACLRCNPAVAFDPMKGSPEAVHIEAARSFDGLSPDKGEGASPVQAAISQGKGLKPSLKDRKGSVDPGDWAPPTPASGSKSRARENAIFGAAMGGIAGFALHILSMAIINPPTTLPLAIFGMVAATALGAGVGALIGWTPWRKKPKDS